jgi:adenine specific DNA methylase Mod
VKCLFDEVFGEGNYVDTLHWKRKKQPSFLAKHTAKVMEFVLVYAKKWDLLGKLSIETLSDATKKVVNLTNQDSIRHFSKGVRVKCGENGVIKKGKYTIKTMSVEYLNDIVYQNGLTQNEVDVRAKFSVSQEKIDNYIAQKLLFITANYGLRRDVSEEETKNAKAITDLLIDWGDNQDSEKELKEVFNGKLFDYSKPVKLVSNLIKSASNSEAIILDFFAGSGTTGHAVLDLNSKDEGNRAFILCQLNEQTDTTPNGIAYDVTAKRLKRIMTGECYDGTKDFKWIKENQPYGGNLDVYEISSVANFEATKGKTPFDVIDETLYGQQKFNTLQEKVDWVCQNFANTQKKLEE